jgi:hypothetical protein
MTDNSQLTDQAAKLLEDLRTLLEKGGQFVLEQAPPLAKEIVAYGRIESLAEILIFGTVTLFCVRWFFTKYEDWKENSRSLDFPAAPLAAGMVGLQSCGLTTFAISCAFKAWLAPRLYLLEYVGSLLHGGCT